MSERVDVTTYRAIEDTGMQRLRALDGWLRAAAIGISMLVLALLMGCSDPQEPTDAPRSTADPDVPLSVYAANYPLKYFAERIGGAQVRVGFPAPAGIDPAYWKPTADEVAAYQSADIVLLNGASYSGWVAYSSLPLFRTVDTSAPFRNQYIPFEGKVTHSHGSDGEHEHGKVAFTTWLDPILAIAQATSIRDVLVSRYPEHEDAFNQGFDSLAADLKELDDSLSAAFALVGEQPLIFSHPVYQYLIRRYHINGESVHWEPDRMPTPEQWQELDQLLVRHPARWLIWEADPDPSTVDESKGRGLDSLTFDPCANTPAEGDYLSVMRENARRVSEAFSP